MKKLNAICNTIMCTGIGIFIGHGIYIVLDFKKHPARYAMQSAPWYTSILTYGAVTVTIFIICLVIKAIFNRKIKN